MAELYVEIRFVHVAAVVASGLLFFARGLALVAGARWPLSGTVRRSSYAIDTVLLTAALMLMTILNQYPFAQAWLTVKVVLLLVYIGLGFFAFHRLRAPALRCLVWMTAVAVYVFIFSVARAHDALGLFRGLAA